MKEHAQTCPDTKKRKMARLNATKRDLVRSQTLVTAYTYTGTADLRAPHIACKRSGNPDVAAISPPFWDAPARGVNAETSEASFGP